MGLQHPGVPPLTAHTDTLDYSLHCAATILAHPPSLRPAGPALPIPAWTPTHCLSPPPLLCCGCTTPLPVPHRFSDCPGPHGPAYFKVSNHYKQVTKVQQHTTGGGRRQGRKGSYKGSHGPQNPDGEFCAGYWVAHPLRHKMVVLCSVYTSTFTSSLILIMDFQSSLPFMVYGQLDWLHGQPFLVFFLLWTVCTFIYSWQPFSFFLVTDLLCLTEP